MYVLGCFADRSWLVSRKELVQIRLKKGFWGVLDNANAVAFGCRKVDRDGVKLLNAVGRHEAVVTNLRTVGRVRMPRPVVLSWAGILMATVWSPIRIVAPWTSAPSALTFLNVFPFLVVGFVLGHSDSGIEMHARVEEVDVRLDMLGHAVLVTSNVTSTGFFVLENVVLCIEELLGFERSRLVL